MDEKIQNLPMSKEATPEEIYESGRKYGLIQAEEYIQYILTYGLKDDVTEEEIEKCEELMRVFSENPNIKEATE